ncbi:MAG: LLM class F420-dependent oxidoreductase [Chloroflexi bacterium]|nr:LLM class F420-dependent oxidoreductase [Chloroflexota bacterium]
MKYGVFIFATDLAMDPVSLAVAAEERGFESLFVPEHVHMPVERETRFPRSEDGSLPDEYRRIHDPFVALAAAAGATSEIRLGTGICLVTEHEPIALAKQIASLDMISGGRFEFGIGAGWLAEEMEPLGVRFADRWKVTEQRIAAMKEMWTQDEAEYHSEFVDIPKTYVIPKPTQNPYPPILIGAGSKWARQRIVDWADGWLPNITAPGFVERGIQDIQSRASEAGRDFDEISINVFGAVEDGLAEYERMGVDRCVFRLPDEGADTVIPELDRLAKLIA